MNMHTEFDNQQHENEHTVKYTIDKPEHEATSRSFDDRSTDVKICNHMGSDMIRLEYEIESGKWKRPPAPKIKSGDTDIFSTKSTAWLKGAGGWVKYLIKSEGTTIRIRLRWFNPYMGSNSYEFYISHPNYKIERIGDGSGNNAQIGWKITKK